MMEPLPDNLVLERISDVASGLEGFLAIDSVFGSKAVGGVRILPDVTLAEVSHMSRTMTRKYLFSGILCGGAKAGIVLPPGADRRRVLLAFGKALRPYLLRGFWPGTDLGSGIVDIKTILEGAGVPSMSRRNPPSDKYTAMGVMHSIDAALEHAGLGWSGLRIAIEGFGKVGSETARICEKKGAKLVAFSNTRGALFNPSGFDVPGCVSLWERDGSPFISALGKLQPKESLFGADCDVLLPAARCWSINEGNFRNIRAKIIVSAANVPMTLQIERSLFGRGKVIVPDGIANCGGVAGLALSRYFDDGEIDSIFRERLRPRVLDVLAHEGPPSGYLDSFCRKRLQLLGWQPRGGRMDVLLNTLKYHTTERFFGRERMLSSSFPSEFP